MTAGNDAIRDALLLAEEFIAQELENRESGGDIPGPNGDYHRAYVQECRDVLGVVREALR